MPTISQLTASAVIISALAFTLSSCDSSSMNDRHAPSAPHGNSRQFDFWLGEWDLTWPNGGQGENIVTLELDSSVVQEAFNGQPAIQLIGRSVSVFVPRENLWKQTWVDNQGGYLDFTGGLVEERMILSRAAVNQEGGQIIQRMVWYNITSDSLNWNWERSNDSGKSWEILWQIHYKRKSAL